jgi:NTE family protein
VIASGSLPPGFPAVEIEGEFYWDGGLISNTPLQWVVEQGPRQDTLAFQVDLWSGKYNIRVARAPIPISSSSTSAPEKRSQVYHRPDIVGCVRRHPHFIAVLRG